MKALTTVLFSRDESKAIAAAGRSIRIGFPDYDELDRKQARRPNPFPLTGLANEYGPVTHQRLAAAIEAARVVRDQLALEATPEHWQQFIDRPPEGATVTVPAGAIPMIADPEQMAKVLVEARTQQLGEVDRALEILTEALSIASPPPEDDDD